MNLDPKKMYEWPRSTQMLVFAVVFVFVFYLGYRWDIASVQVALATSQQQEHDLKQQYELAIAKETTIRNDLAQSPALLDLIAKWKNKLVKSSNLPELLNEILKTGANNNLYFSLFSPGEAAKAGNYIKVPIKVIAVGSYQQIANFISQVVNMPWIVVVGDFVITNENKNDELGSKMAEEARAGNLLTAQLMLDVYYLAGGTP